MKPLTPTTPHVIIMVGIPGAGKTTFAEHFAKTFSAPYINQATIVQQAELSKHNADKVSHILLTELLKTNRTLVYEGATATRLQRLTLGKQIIKAGYRPLIVWVQTESVEAKRRATKSSNVAAVSPSTFDAAIRTFQPPLAVEKAVVMSGKHTYATQIKVVLKHLAGTRPATADSSEPDQPRPRTGRNIIVR
ncbi:AAA family ATPase [Candidatus Saccharibacteria bacterium]|nr:AAA family ATPase [Candidatus Saccharibacteria bacterium]